jgi:hypothetical protein
MQHVPFVKQLADWRSKLVVVRLFLFEEMLRMFSAMATSVRKLIVSKNYMPTQIVFESLWYAGMIGGSM